MADVRGGGIIKGQKGLAPCVNYKQAKRTESDIWVLTSGFVSLNSSFVFLKNPLHAKDAAAFKGVFKNTKHEFSDTSPGGKTPIRPGPKPPSRIHQPN